MLGHFLSRNVSASYVVLVLATAYCLRAIKFCDEFDKSDYTDTYLKAKCRAFYRERVQTFVGIQKGHQVSLVYSNALTP